jgi:hypothetical protein
MTKKDQLRLILLIFTVLFVFCPIAGHLKSEDIIVYANNTARQTAVVTATPTPSVIVGQTVTEGTGDPIKDYIIEVFGDQSYKALLVLQGDGKKGECSENKALNPRALNDNTKWGGKGRDRGIFQISDYWHPVVTDEQAFNYKENINYAYRMFKNDGNTFAKRWTCGKYWDKLGYDI